MKIVHRKISELRSGGYNPRMMTDAQRKQLKESMQRFGIQQPVIVNMHSKRRNIIVGGHQRVEIAKELKLKEIPCVEMKLTLAKERELNIRLNKNTGQWDPTALEKFFNVKELLHFGFTEKELEFDVAALVDRASNNKKIREKIAVAFQLGEVRFEIDEALYIKWMDKMLKAGHTTKKQKVQCLKKRLQLS